MNRRIYEVRAHILKALAHPSRLQIVDILNEQGEVCACDLMEIVGSDQSTVWKHLSVLKQAGIVDDRKEGKKAIYRLLRPCVMSFFDCVERVLDENLKERQRVLSSS
jgi:ArsR family transcriptional regulator